MSRQSKELGQVKTRQMRVGRAELLEVAVGLPLPVSTREAAPDFTAHIGTGLAIAFLKHVYSSVAWLSPRRERTCQMEPHSCFTARSSSPKWWSGLMLILLPQGRGGLEAAFEAHCPGPGQGSGACLILIGAHAVTSYLNAPKPVRCYLKSVKCSSAARSAVQLPKTAIPQPHRPDLCQQVTPSEHPDPSGVPISTLPLLDQAPPFPLQLSQPFGFDQV